MAIYKSALTKVSRRSFVRGAILDVEVCLPQRQARIMAGQAQSVPATMTVRAIVDTSSDTTSVDSRLIQSLKPTAVNFVPTISSSGHSVPKSYAMRIVVRPNVPDPAGNHAASGDYTVSVVEGKLHAKGYDVAIGWDILKKCRFSTDGPRNEFILDFT